MATAPTIYIVDDDDAVRDSLGLLFDIEGLQVRSFASARAFLADLSTVGAGCLITDVHMPDMNGLQLLRQLRALGRKLPVIIVTGRADGALCAEAMAAGASAILEKPFSPDEIVAEVRAAIAGARSSDDELDGRPAG